MRVLALLVMLLLAVGAAVAQDDNATAANDGAGNDTATDGGAEGGNATEGGEGAAEGGDAAADCISEITLDGKDDFKWYLAEGSGPNPRLAVCANAQVTFTIRVPADQGAPHNFKIEAPDAPPTTAILNPGDEATYVWTTPASGSFRYICVIHGATMSGTVTVGAPTAPTGGGGDENDTISGPSVQLKQIAPQAECDREIPAIVTRDIVGGPTVQDYVDGCVQTADAGEPEAHPVDLVLPLSWALIALGVVGVVWVHKYYKP